MHLSPAYMPCGMMSICFHSLNISLNRWHSAYLAASIGGMSIYTFWYLVAPHVAFILRFIGFTQFLIVGVCMTTLACTALTAYFVAAQLFCIYRGQTRPEFLLG
jgi:hypothetical protein